MSEKSSDIDDKIKANRALAYLARKYFGSQDRERVVLYASEFYQYLDDFKLVIDRDADYMRGDPRHALQRLERYFISGNRIPVERASIKTDDFKTLMEPCKREAVPSA